MGKRIISRARGHGGPRYRAPGHRYAGAISYPREGAAKVIDIIHDPARDAPLAVLEQADGSFRLTVAAEGIAVGDMLSIGQKDAEARPGAIMPLSAVPKGSWVFGLESTPGSGPKLCTSAGTRALVVGHEPTKIILQMPSKQFKNLNPRCWATVGMPAGGGAGDKPLIKAGQAYWASRARNRLWPRSSANKMNPVDHPFGGKTKPGTPKSISRWAPPGAKVGSIAARRSGWRKK